MDIRKTIYQYKLSDDISVDVISSNSSFLFYIKFEIFNHQSVLNLKEYCLISPSFNNSFLGNNAISSLYRNNINNHDGTFIVTDCLNEQYYYKKIYSDDNYIYSMSNNEKLQMINNEYCFRNKNNIITCYETNNHYPKSIYYNEKSDKGLNYSFSYNASNNISSIISNKNNEVINLSYSINNVTRYELKKNNQTYEYITFSRNNNNQISEIRRYYHQTLSNSYSITYLNNEIRIVDNISYKSLKIIYSNDNQIVSITRGINNNFYNESIINFINSDSYKVITEPNNHFQYFKKGNDNIAYSFNDYGYFKQDKYQLINNERIDSYRIIKTLNYNGNIPNTKKENIFNNGYFENNLANFEFDNNNFSLINNNDLYYKQIIGNKLLRINNSNIITITINNDNLIINRPYFLSFWYKQLFNNGTVNIKYYLDNELIKSNTYILDSEVEQFTLFNKSIILNEYINKIVISINANNFYLGGIRLIKECPYIDYQYDNDTGILNAVHNDLDNVQLSSQDLKIYNVSSSLFHVKYVYDNNLIKQSYNEYGGIIDYQYDNDFLVNKITVNDFKASKYCESVFDYDETRLIYQNDENGNYENYHYSSNSDLLSYVDNGTVKTNYQINFSHKLISTSFSLIDGATLSTNNFEYNEDDKKILYYSNNNKIIQNLDNNFNVTSLNYYDNNDNEEKSIESYSYSFNKKKTSYIINTKTNYQNDVYEYWYNNDNLFAILFNYDQDFPYYEASFDNEEQITSIYDGLNELSTSYSYDINHHLISYSSNSIQKTYKYSYNHFLYERYSDSIDNKLIFTDNNLNTHIDKSYYLNILNEYNVSIINNINNNNQYSLNASSLYQTYSFGMVFVPQEKIDDRKTLLLLSIGTNYKILVFFTKLDNKYYLNINFSNGYNGIAFSSIIDNVPLGYNIFNIKFKFNNPSQIIFKIKYNDVSISNVYNSEVPITFNNRIQAYFGRDELYIEDIAYNCYFLYPYLIEQDINENNLNRFIDNHYQYCLSRNNYCPKSIIYSYKDNNYENYLPLNKTLEGNNNQYPISILNEPRFVYDDILNHYVLSTLKNGFIYSTKTNNQFYIALRFRLELSNFDNNFILSLIANNKQHKLGFVANYNTLFLTDGDNLYNIGSISNSTWNSFGVFVKEISNTNLSIDIYINNNEPINILLPYKNISGLFFALGSDSFVDNQSFDSSNSLYGYMENIIYGYDSFSNVDFQNYIQNFLMQYSLIEYDSLGRIKSEKNNFESLLNTNYSYVNKQTINNKTKTTSLINSISISDNNNFNFEFNYSYTNNNLLNNVNINNKSLNYSYDEFHRITSFSYLNNAYSYSYDNNGNIFINHNPSSGTINSNDIREYDTSDFNKLIKCGQNNYSYDGLLLKEIFKTNLAGNIIVQKSFSYIDNQIKEINLNLERKTIKYQYYNNGLRAKKTIYSTPNNSIIDEINYIYDNGKLVFEKHSSFYLRFNYTQLNKLYSIEKFNINNDRMWIYYYIVDAYNDVYGLINNNHEVVVSYLYDPFGKLIEVIDNSNIDLSNINPFRYKSYYYDNETKYYYLNSRYYDPIIARFINPDSVEYLDHQSINGLNLYAYCGNDPVNKYDPTGHSAILIGLIIGAVIGAAIGFGTAAYIDYKDDGQVFNGSVEWYDYLGATAFGGAIGAGIGAGIGYIAPQIAGALSSFASSSFTLGGGMFISASGVATMSTGLTITGTQILQGAGILSGITIMASIIGKSGGYTVKKFPNDHDPTHVHIFGDDIADKAHGIKVGLDGNPLPGQGKLPPGARKALKKLWKLIIKALLK